MLALPGTFRPRLPQRKGTGPRNVSNQQPWLSASIPRRRRPMHLYRLRCTLPRKTSYTSDTLKVTLSKTTVRALSSLPSRQSPPTSKRLSSCPRHILSSSKVLPHSMAPRPALEKQYMSSGSKPAKQVVEPRPSASFVLVSPYSAPH